MRLPKTLHSRLSIFFRYLPAGFFNDATKEEKEINNARKNT
jgi:hypothetical protein